MTRYLVDCELEELDLEIPREHAPDLVAWFDGRHEGERAAAKARATESELCFEAAGGRLLLELDEDHSFRARDLELSGDADGQFFEAVVVNLFRAYQGTLSGRVRWSAREAQQPQRDAWLQVKVRDGHSTWPSGATGKWLARPSPVPAPAGEGPEESADSLREIVEKLNEAERYFAEYLRLKEQRGLAKG
ncbi:MAG TPA: hypothetical protein VGK67_16015 [Myxococcales bacterium]|jgi:hypothetical protein